MGRCARGGIEACAPRPLYKELLQPGMLLPTLNTMRDLFDQYRDQQLTHGVVVDFTALFMAAVERGVCACARPGGAYTRA